MHSIAKYTKDYTHYDRCNPDPKDLLPLSPVVRSSHVENKALPNSQAQNARMLASRPPTEIENMHHSQLERRRSRSSTMLMSSVDPTALVSGGEPRIFPGLVHERTRRQSLRQSTSGSDGGGDGPPPGGLMKVATKEREVLNGAVVEEADVEGESE